MKSSNIQAPSPRGIPMTKHQNKIAIPRPATMRHWSLRLGASLVLGSWCLVLSLATNSFAQSLSIDWFTIAGGGGTSAGGAFAVSGTIGQSDASAQPMTGDNFSLVGGFWSLLAVQTPGAPLLSLRLTTTNTVVVSWPSPSTGFILQQNTDLNTPNWVTAPQSVADNGTKKFILVNPSGNCFYRLVKP